MLYFKRRIVKAIYKNILDMIGRTPVVKRNRLTGENDADVYVKCEFFNPCSSVKDRNAKSMIEDAEKRVFWIKLPLLLSQHPGIPE